MISVCLDARIVILALQPYLQFGIVGNDAEFFCVYHLHDCLVGFRKSCNDLMSST